MLKAADALAEAGYAVHVVATRHEPWATAADLDVRSRREWPITIVNYCRGERGSTYWRTGIEHRSARMLDARAPVRRPAFAAAVERGSTYWRTGIEHRSARMLARAS